MCDAILAYTPSTETEASDAGEEGMDLVQIVQMPSVSPSAVASDQQPAKPEPKRLTPHFWAKEDSDMDVDEPADEPIRPGKSFSAIRVPAQGFLWPPSSVFELCAGASIWSLVTLPGVGAIPTVDLIPPIIPIPNRI